jgi:hypothetical protein
LPFGNKHDNELCRNQDTNVEHSLSFLSQLFVSGEGETLPLKATEKGLQYFSNSKVFVAPKRTLDKALFTVPVLHSLSTQKALLTAKTAEEDGVISS